MKSTIDGKKVATILANGVVVAGLTRLVKKCSNGEMGGVSPVESLLSYPPSPGVFEEPATKFLELE